MRALEGDARASFRKHHKPLNAVLHQRGVSYRKQYGGETGIRTLDRVSPIHAFQACAFNHSAISPA